MKTHLIHVQTTIKRIEGLNGIPDSHKFSPYYLINFVFRTNSGEHVNGDGEFIIYKFHSFITLHSQFSNNPIFAGFICVTEYHAWHSSQS